MRDARLKQINKLIDVWVDQACSTDNDAGWTGSSLLDRLIQYQGQAPKGTGSTSPDARVLASLHLVRKRHALYSLAHLCLMRLSEPARLALIASRFYEGKADDRGRRYTADRIAKAIGQGGEQYRYQLKSARRDTAKLLELVDDLKAAGLVA